MPGKYVIHVSTSPDVQDAMDRGEYATILVELKR